jgi:hypothetical protein
MELFLDHARLNARLLALDLEGAASIRSEASTSTFWLAPPSEGGTDERLDQARGAIKVSKI